MIHISTKASTIGGSLICLQHFSNLRTRSMTCLRRCRCCCTTGAISLNFGRPLWKYRMTKVYGPCWSKSSMNYCSKLRCSIFLSLLQKITHDLRTTLSPVYTDLLSHLLNLLPRSLSPAALTALLETFSSLFKHLLVPAISTTLLEQTWADVRAVLPNCLPEIQRTMAEVWASLLRRLKTTSREKAVTLLAESIIDVEDATAWVFVYACKVRHYPLLRLSQL